MQTGNRELPEFNEFLTFWIECLGKQRGRRTEELLKEAQSMVQDDSTLLENAGKYTKEHPSLYKQLLEMKLNSGENQKMLQIGMEALGSIPDSYCDDTGCKSCPAKMTRTALGLFTQFQSYIQLRLQQ